MSQFREFILDVFIRIITLNYLVVRNILDKNIPQRRNLSILDLGCGTGVLASLFPPKNYLGVDIDEHSIRRAKKKFPKHQFKMEDATDLRLNKKFDLAMIVGVVHHLNDMDALKLFDNLKIHLKKNSRVVLVEAIPPIFKWNIIGGFLRKIDRGAYVRKLPQYERLAEKKFRILDAYAQKGGIIDYGVLVLGN